MSYESPGNFGRDFRFREQPARSRLLCIFARSQPPGLQIIRRPADSWEIHDAIASRTHALNQVSRRTVSHAFPRAKGVSRDRGESAGRVWPARARRTRIKGRRRPEDEEARPKAGGRRVVTDGDENVSASRFRPSSGGRTTAAEATKNVSETTNILGRHRSRSRGRF